MNMWDVATSLMKLCWADFTCQRLFLHFLQVREVQSEGHSCFSGPHLLFYVRLLLFLPPLLPSRLFLLFVRLCPSLGRNERRAL